jgi:hypothetical protein
VRDAAIDTVAMDDAVSIVHSLFAAPGSGAKVIDFKVNIAHAVDDPVPEGVIT